MYTPSFIKIPDGWLKNPKKIGWIDMECPPFFLLSHFAPVNVSYRGTVEASMKHLNVNKRDKTAVSEKPSPFSALYFTSLKMMFNKVFRIFASLNFLFLSLP